MFYLLGIFTALGAYIMLVYSKTYILRWSSWLIGVLTIILSLFTMAWSWSSILEGEPQAAGIGLIVFGIPSVIMVFITRKVILKSEVKLLD